MLNSRCQGNADNQNPYFLEARQEVIDDLHHKQASYKPQRHIVNQETTTTLSDESLRQRHPVTIHLSMCH